MTVVDCLAWVLVAVFAWAGALNLYGPSFVRAEFQRWGYPRGLRLAVGGAEWLAAVLLLWPASRFFGATVGLAILFGVVLSLGRTREWMRLEYPAVLITLCILLIAHDAAILGLQQ